MKRKGEETEETEEEEPKKKDLWEVKLVIVDEDKPPKKYLTKGEKTLDLYSAIAKLLNEQEIIKKAITT